MLRLIRTQRGRKGVWRTYWHARLGQIEVITMTGKKGSADVIHIQGVRHVVQQRRSAELLRREAAV
jgi:hypothetical protein